MAALDLNQLATILLLVVILASIIVLSFFVDDGMGSINEKVGPKGRVVSGFCSLGLLVPSLTALLIATNSELHAVAALCVFINLIAASINLWYAYRGGGFTSKAGAQV